MFSHAALNASLNGTSAVLLACGYAAIRTGKVAVHKAFMISAFVVSSVFLVSYLAYHYRVGHVVFPGARVGFVPFILRCCGTHTVAGDCHRADDSDYLATGLAGEVRQAPHYCSMDFAAMVLCLRYRRDCLPDGLSDLRAKELVCERCASGR